MACDQTLDLDLEICLPKPFTSDSIAVFATAAPFIAQLRQSLLARRWPEIRTVVMAAFLAPHVERLERQ